VARSKKPVAGRFGDAAAAAAGRLVAGNRARNRAVIFGCSGPELTKEERRFFAEICPTGFILFARNCHEPGQIKRLVSDLRDVIDDPGAPVLIDQEGGRVQRLGPPHWRAVPAAAAFGDLARRDAQRAAEAVRLNARLIAADLCELGINVDCAPVIDVPQADADRIIGDRAFGGDPGIVATLGLAACKGFLAGGVLPVIKHIPGHGRALADSHATLPVVDADETELERVDFAPFRALNRMPWAMTAHVVYNALDPDRPATTSPKVIERTIRGAIGFDGVLVSDDIGMKALRGPFDKRASAAMAAGCDLVLHCSGSLAEMKEVVAGVGAISEATASRLARGAAMPGNDETWNREAALARVEEIMSGAATT
jgi:beta-N-acetylhexosaminidase